MGAAGAGLATFLSNCAACVYFFVLLAVRGKKTYVCIRPSMFPWDRRIASGVCAVGIPAAIQNHAVFPRLRQGLLSEIRKKRNYSMLVQ